MLPLEIPFPSVAVRAQDCAAHKQNRTLNTAIGRVPLKDLCGHSARNVREG